MARQRVILHIDRLVLRGIDRADAAAVAAALEVELRERLEAGGAEALSRWNGLESVRTGVAPLAAGSSPAAVGHAIGAKLLAPGGTDRTRRIAKETLG